MTFTIGIDPDLHDTSVGVWGPDGPVSARVIHLPTIRGRGREDAVTDMVEALEDALPQLALELQAHDIARIAVEGQSLRRQGPRQHRRPDDIVRLAQVAGVCVGFCRSLFGADVVMPDPERWKGSVPKHAHQARLYNELGWGYEKVGKGPDYSRPANPPATFRNISRGQWKHVGDALLLAKWAQKNR